MFYAKNPEVDKQFRIDDTQHQKNKINKPPSAKAPSGRVASAKPTETPKNKDSLLKEAGSKAVNYPQITHDILDQHMANNILMDLGRDYKNSNDGQVEKYLNQYKHSGQSPQRSGSSNQDNQLLTQMAGRLQKSEKLCHSLKQEVKEQQQKIRDLQDQLELLNKGTDSQAVIDENKKLKLQINEMEKFLLEYGIKWVGSQTKVDKKRMDQLVKDAGPSKLKFNYHLPKEIQLDVLTRRVEELNFIMEKEGATEVVKNAQGMHQLKKMDPLPIGFYKNGIVLKGYPFYTYGSDDACHILADILDGYFPYLLKNKYPKGTLMKVIDKMDDIYQADDKKQYDVQSIDEKALQPKKKEEFLQVLIDKIQQNLPEHVIHNGKIIQVRSEIAQKFEPKAATKILPKNSRLDEQDGRTIIIITAAQLELDSGKPYDEERMTSLKFRTESGTSTIIAVMYTDQTVAEMYEIVRPFQENQGMLEIIQNYPRMSFEPSSKSSLLEMGLFPNAQLFFK